MLEEADPEARLMFTLALHHRNLDILEQKLYEDADPTSPKYAQHLSREEIMALIAPTRDVQHQVISWIRFSATKVGASSLVDLKNFEDAIQVTCTVKLAKELFHATFHYWHNTLSGMRSIKHIGELSLPGEISKLVQLVTGITELPPHQGKLLQRYGKAKRQDGDNACNTPYSMKNLYNIPQDLQVTNPDANASIYAEVSFDTPEGFGVGSLSYWESANNLPANPIKCILGNGAGDFVPDDTDTEALLDTQMMTGFAVGAQTCFYIMQQGYSWMYEFAMTVFNTPNAPLVVSMSYGWIEFQQCVNASNPDYWFLGNCTYLNIPSSQDYVNRTNVEFMKLGLKGHTLLAASGDDGTAGTHNSPDNCETMGPIFPAASPFVLTFGATSVEPGSTHSKVGDDQPPVCTDYNTYQCTCSTSTNEQPALQTNTAGFDTGGGFSWFSPMPSYQQAAVADYIASGVALPAQNLWNQNNRGFPDISAVGENVCCLDPDSSCELIGGTSAATPILGAMVTLLNNDRLNAGKTPLGFINPLIYQLFQPPIHLLQQQLRTRKQWRRMWS